MTLNMKRILLFLASLTMAACAFAQEIGTGNPYLPLWEHLPDGEPRVFEDPDNPGKYRIYIIGSHDVRFKDYCGSDIRMWSAPVEDLTDWTDEGPIFTYQYNGKWDVMFAPDLVEVRKKDGTKEYYLYPHSRGWHREAMVCKGTRPDGPFTPVNLTPDGEKTVEGSVLGFDPSIFVEQITDPADPDYEIGFRAYGFWGFQRSSAAQLDQSTMYSVRPGTEWIPYFIPASVRYGLIRDTGVSEYPALYKDQKPEDFNYFEASSIRKVGNKYVMIFSGYSGPDYGIGSSNSTLRYAYGDSPLGPWRSGGVLVDSRGVVPNQDGTELVGGYAAHNTHGSIEQINGKWYVFYHRPPRGFGFARQAMVAPITIEWDEALVADGGTLKIQGYDPYAKDGVWKAAASNGHVYNGAEVTSEGFQIYGLDPYKYYSAGYACYLSNVSRQQDTWDIWDNSMPVDMYSGDIVGYKYFGFEGLAKAKDGLKPFKGARKGNKTAFNLFLTPKTDEAFTVSVWLDGPWDNDTWKGKKIAEVNVPAGSAEKVTRFTVDVAKAVEGLKGKHAIFLVAEGDASGKLCDLMGLGFSRKGQEMNYPAPPVVSISVDGKALKMPSIPVRMTADNGYTGYDQYEVFCDFEVSDAPVVEASADNPQVKIEVVQAQSKDGRASVRFDYNGIVKTCTVNFKPQAPAQQPRRQRPQGGFGGFQKPDVEVRCSEKFTDIDYAGDEQVYHQLDIYLPKEKKDLYPVVIHVYGSAWFSNNSKGMADLGTIVNALLDAGYAVVTPNHRSSMDAKFPAQIQDIKAVVRFVRANANKFKLDPTFIATSGFSSGAHLAGLTATSGGVKELEGNVGGNEGFSSNVDAACCWSGPMDLHYMSCGKDVDEWNHGPEEAVMGFKFAGNEERFKALNATTYIDAGDPPVIVFHGTEDNVVPPCQGPHFYELLDKAGVDTELYMVEGGGHGMGMYAPENLKRMTDFLNRIRTANQK